jgi:DNA polymerase-3 subunit epsilon
MNLDLRSPLCFFDLETTGTNITKDRILEIAVIRMMPDGTLLRKSDIINPGIPIPPESTAIHGIGEEAVLGKPVFKEVAKEYVRFFEGADLAGFNILKFDVPMLVEEFLRADVEFDYGRKRIVDAQKIFHLMEKRTLAAAHRFYLGNDMTNSHSAVADTEATMAVLLAQLDRYLGQEVTDGLNRKLGEIKNDVESLSKITVTGLIDLAGRMTRNDNGQEIYNFGKHKNIVVAAVLKEEPSYYDWIMNGDFPMDTKRKLTEIKLRNFNR